MSHPQVSSHDSLFSWKAGSAPFGGGSQRTPHLGTIPSLPKQLLFSSTWQHPNRACLNTIRKEDWGYEFAPASHIWDNIGKRATTKTVLHPPHTHQTKPLTSKHRDLSPLRFTLAHLLEVIFTDIELNVGNQKWVCCACINAGTHVHTWEGFGTQRMLLWKIFVAKIVCYLPIYIFFFKIRLNLYQDVTSFIAWRVYFYYNGSGLTSHFHSKGLGWPEISP